jgi:photosystem II stability/assembly factor-like uncharacterized protein
MNKLRIILFAITVAAVSFPASAQTLEHLHLVCASTGRHVSVSTRGVVRSEKGKPFIWDSTGGLWAALNDPYLGDSLQSYSCIISPTGAIFDNLSNGWSTCSEDLGKTFTRIVIPNQTTLKISPDGELFALGVSWIARSQNDGQTWDSIPADGLLPIRCFFDRAGDLLSFQLSKIFDLRKGQTTFDSIGTWNFSFPTFTAECSMDSNSIIIAGDDSLFVFHKGNNSWDRILLPARMQGELCPLCCDSTGHLYGGIWGSLMRSDDTGHTWQFIDSGSSVTEWLAFQSPSTIWGATVSHCYQYREQTHSFAACDTPFVELGIATIAANYDTVYAAAQDDSALFRSTDDGDHWMQIHRDSGFRIVGTSSIQFSPDGSTYLTDFTSLYKSYGGIQWNTISNDPSLNYLTFAVDSSAKLFLTDVGFTSDDGRTWQKSSIPTWPAINSYGFLCYTRDSLFVYSRDDGQTWDTSIVHDPRAAGWSWIHSRFERIWLSYDSALFLSTDRATTWSNAEAGLPTLPQHIGPPNMTTDPYDHTFCIVGHYPTNSSIYGWSLLKKSWTQLTPDTSIGVVSICSNSKYLFLGTQSGVFRVAISDFNLGVLQTSSSTLESAVAYPNPSSNGFAIRFYLDQSSPVTITIYDAVGRSVEHFNAGEHEAGWISIPVAPGLPPGAYTYQVIAAGATLRGRVAIVSP